MDLAEVDLALEALGTPHSSPAYEAGLDLEEVDAALEALADGPAARASQAIEAAFERTGETIERAFERAARSGETSFSRLTERRMRDLARLAAEPVSEKPPSGEHNTRGS